MLASGSVRPLWWDENNAASAQSYDLAVLGNGMIATVNPLAEGRCSYGGWDIYGRKIDIGSTRIRLGESTIYFKGTPIPLGTLGRQRAESLDLRISRDGKIREFSAKLPVKNTYRVDLSDTEQNVKVENVSLQLGMMCPVL